MLNIEDIRKYCNDYTIVLTEHLVTRMRQRNIRLADIKNGDRIMKCGICKAEMEQTTVTYTEDIEQGVVVIRYVPAQVCSECGNTWYSGTIIAQLEKIVDQFAASTGSEVSVINFRKLAA